MCYASAMAKKTTIDDLAIITAKGFKGVDKRFEEVGKPLDALEKDVKAMDTRFDRIETLLLRDQTNRLERLEDTVLQLKVKAGMR